MRGAFGLATLFLVVVAAGAAGSGGIEIDAPGGVWYERDGTVSARGTKDKPLVVTLNGYEISAQSLHYDQRKRTGQALGNVRWRERRAAGGVREIGADSLSFALTSKTIRAEGRVTAKEQGVELQAERALVDLGNGVYQAEGHPAQVSYPPQLVTGRQIRYDAKQARLTAGGDVVWRLEASEAARTVSAAWVDCDFSAGRTEATGGIRVTSGEVELSAERLHYEASTDSYTVTGQPVLSRGEFRLSAACLAWRPAQGVATATGGASFTDSDFSGTSEEIRLVTGENLVFLVGGARIVQGQSVLTGAEMVYDLAAKRVQVTGPARVTIFLGE